MHTHSYALFPLVFFAQTWVRGQSSPCTYVRATPAILALTLKSGVALMLATSDPTRVALQTEESAVFQECTMELDARAERARLEELWADCPSQITPYRSEAGPNGGAIASGGIVEGERRADRQGAV